jgi:mRNA-degrading endonuclease toxin of MazEF toxin-antitoxin module
VFCFGPEEPVPISMVLAEQITTISKSVLGLRIGKIQNTEKLREIDTALMNELGICDCAVT